MNRPYFLILVLLLAACSGIRVNYDYDKSVDFSQYNSYFHIPWDEKAKEIIGEFDRERLEAAVKDEMARRGIEYKEGGDLAVSLFVHLEEKQQVTAYTTHLGYGGYGYYGWGWGMGATSTNYSTTDYVDGTLVVSVFDANTKKLIWEGIGSGTVDENPQSRERGIPKAINSIFYYFPVKPQKGK